MIMITKISKVPCISEFELNNVLVSLERGKFRGKAALVYRTRSGLAAAIGTSEYVRERITETGKGGFRYIPKDLDTYIVRSATALVMDRDIQ